MIITMNGRQYRLMPRIVWLGDLRRSHAALNAVCKRCCFKPPLHQTCEMEQYREVRRHAGLDPYGVSHMCCKLGRYWRPV